MKNKLKVLPTDAKKLESITIGTTVVDIVIERFPGSIRTTATSGKEIEVHTQTLHPNKDTKAEHLETDRNRIVQKLAEIVAGKVQSESLLDGLFSQLPSPK